MNEHHNEEQEQELKVGSGLRAILSNPWMIEEPALWRMIHIAGRQNLNIAEAISIAKERRETRFEIMEGERLKGTRSVYVNANGVAVLPVFDSLFRRADMFNSISGAMSMEMIERDFNIAMYDSKNVKAIMLDVDSPGGEVNYTEELSNTIFNARGVKPMETFVSGSMASGAFWIGTSADRINANNSAFMGSVGVIATYVSTKAWEKKMGVEKIEIVSSVSPDKRPDVTTDEGKAKIQSLVDSLGENFVQAMSKNLDLSADQIKEWKGGVLIGKNAIEAGMGHELTDRNTVMSRLASGGTPASQSTAGAHRAAMEQSSSGQNEIVIRDVIIKTDSADETILQLYKEGHNAMIGAVKLPDQVFEQTTAAENDKNIDASDNSATIDSKQEGEQMNASHKLVVALAASLGCSAMLRPESEWQGSQPKSERELELEQQASENFVKLNASRVLPAAQGNLQELHLAATRAGIADKVEAFVASTAPLDFTQDVIKPKENQQIGVATDPADQEDAEIARATASALAYAKEINGQSDA